MDVASDVVEELGRRLLDETEAFPSRYRVLFSLMNVKPSSLTREPLVSCLRTRSHGALLRHEVAYVLGQMQDGDEDAVTTLVDILSDKSDDVMVRHEAAEALGAIADTKCKRVLEKYLKDECKEVSDTCELALRRIEDVEKEKKEKKEKEEGKEEEKQVGSTSQFNTVDPILTQMKEKSLEELEKLALNESASMHDRYDGKRERERERERERKKGISSSHFETLLFVLTFFVFFPFFSPFFLTSDFPAEKQGVSKCRYPLLHTVSDDVSECVVEARGCLRAGPAAEC